MTRTGQPPQTQVPIVIPSLLSFVAGYVDGAIFLALFGVYVAQLTGSFVIAGAEIVSHDETVIIRVVGIPVFLGAAALSTVVSTLAYRRGHFPLVYALGLESVLLVAMLIVALAGGPFSDANAPVALLTSILGLSAMGTQSALVRLLMKGVGSTNVMTTNTTVVAIDVTEMLIAWHDRWKNPTDAAARQQFDAARRRFALLWPLGVGFFLGTLAGALACHATGLGCLIVAIAIVLATTGWASRRGRYEYRGSRSAM
jgi:uncharacterized membrane protein YoaK (UPF0700 family)